MIDFLVARPHRLNGILADRFIEGFGRKDFKTGCCILLAASSCEAVVNCKLKTVKSKL